MAESNAAGVECPLCGERFDPASAGGWCTNSDCGEWQYESEDATDHGAGPEPDDLESNADSPSDAPDAEPSDDGETSPNEWEFESGPEDASAGDSAIDRPEDDSAEPVDEDRAVDELVEELSGNGDSSSDDGSSPNAGASSGDGQDDEDPLDRESTAGTDSVDDEPHADERSDDESGSGEAVAAADESPAPADADPTDRTDPSDSTDSLSSEDGSGGETFDCPGCGSTLDAEVNFCPDCGEDVSDYPADDEDDGDELDVCPSCDADVDPEDSFCASCGEDLDAHRGADELTDCPDCGADVDADDSFCAGCGADLDAYRGDAAGQAAGGPAEGGDSSAPDELALRAHGRSVVVEDGDAVGREIRSLLTDAGRPEDEAVRVHREHVRFVRESGQFYVVALGANPTSVNGVSMSKGDREPIGPGDELSLSDVVTLTVETA